MSETQADHPGGDLTGPDEASGTSPSGTTTRRGFLAASGTVLVLAACASPARPQAEASATALGTTPRGGPVSAGALAAPSEAATSNAVVTAGTGARQPLAALASRVRGRLILPGQSGYSSTALTENPRYDAARPLGLLRPKDANDVATGLRFARENGVPLAIRSGGHSYPGWSSGGAGNGMRRGLVIDTRSLGSIKIKGTSLTVGAGTALAPLYAALAAKGRAIAGGSCATVGIAGLTLGGGVGVLTRAYGLTCDALTSAQIVTADGKVRTVDSRHDAELFWALRGGGGGHLGVVTSLSFSTHAAPTVHTFYLRWRFAHAAAVIAAWQNWAPTADPRLWSTLKMLSGSARKAGAVIQVSGTWIGSGEPPLSGLLRHCPAPSLRSTVTKTYGAAMAGYAGCANVSTKRCHTGSGGALQREAFAATSHVAYSKLSASAISALVKRMDGLRSSPLKEVGVSIDALGGKVRDVKASATAFVHRSALATVQYTATFPGGTAALAQSTVGQLRASMVGSWGEHAYVNYADASLKRAATAYFGANAARLATVRKHYDPHGLFTQPQAY